MDVPDIFEPISSDAPCGPNMEYDLAFVRLEQDAKGKGLQEVRDLDENRSYTVAGELPDWLSVRRQSLRLLTQTKDLRVLIYLAKAELATDGLIPFSETISTLKSLTERFWEDIHPQFDPEDGDLRERISCLQDIGSSPELCELLRRTPLATSPKLGHFSLRDLLVARGELSTQASGVQDDDQPTHETVDAAFQDSGLDQLKQSLDAVVALGANTRTLDQIIRERVASDTVDFTPLLEVIHEIQTVLSDQLTRRGAVLSRASAAPTVTRNESEAGSHGVVSSSMEVRSRHDVQIVLDKVCDYYARCEPSSPVPLLIRRAQRLVNKSLLKIVEDLTPDSVEQLRGLLGQASHDSNAEAADSSDQNNAT